MISSRIICLIFFIILYILVTNGNLPKKIYNGQTVTIEKHPHQVSIQIQNQHLCGGAIISLDHILTTASCVSADKNVVYGNIKILSGTSDIMREEVHGKSEIHQVAYVIFHNYDPRQSWSNDIAILRLTSRITMTYTQQLAPVSTLHFRSSQHYITGWGLDPVLDKMIRYLQYTDVSSISSKSCNDKYYSYLSFNPAQQCCLPRSKTTFIIQGNSGSAVMRIKRIVGVISIFSLNPDHPVIYTRTFDYLNWINYILQNY